MEILLKSDKFKNKIQILNFGYYCKDPSEEDFDNNVEDIAKRFSTISWIDIPKGILNSQIDTKFRNEKSFNGLRLDVLKSGLQKYVRRANCEKALWCAIELDLFAYVKGGEKIRTNMIHRLMVMFYEECAVDYNLIVYFDKYISFLLKRDRTLNDEKFVNVRHTEMKSIVKSVELLCKAQHGRVLSHYGSVFRPTEEKKKHAEGYPLIREIYNSLLPTTISSGFKLQECEKVVKEHVDSFIDCLNKRDDKAFYWAFQIVEKLKKTKRYGHTGPGFLVFAILVGYFDKEKEQLFKISLSWYKELKIKENYMCFTFLIFVHLNYTETNNKIEYSIDYIKAYSKNLANEVIHLDDYVLDMHTAQGRKLGKNKKVFATEGAFVENESVLVNADYKDFYTSISVPSTNSEKETFELTTRAQLNTAKSKPDTYFAKRFGDYLFVKGPYPSIEAASFPIKIAKIKKHLNLTFLNFGMKLLVPDLLKTPLGTRQSCKDGEYPFLFCKSLIETYNKKVHSSKVWPDTEVLDTLVMDIESIDEHLLDYTTLVLFRYFLGVPDFASRNFLLYKGDIYSVDEEAWGKQLDLENCLKGRFEKIKRCIDENKSYFDDIVKNWLELMKIFDGEYPDCFLESMNSFLKK